MAGQCRLGAYVVAAQTTSDVAAAVDFARNHNVRLVVKGGGHSYLGTSNAPDSLLVWMRPMRDIALHDDFRGVGCPVNPAPVPAVSVGAGALWEEVYRAVSVASGRYVQGGGCLTVGVAGLVQGGGFGSLSKAYGTAAASLLEAEVVTADGAVRIANACSEPELFWALKGGGGGTFGVVTRLTLRTHSLPETIGAVLFGVEAKSQEAWRALVDRMLAFYAEALFNPHWGEQVTFRRGRRLAIAMVFHGLDKPAAEAVWRPFLGWLAQHADDYAMQGNPVILAAPGQRFWDPAFLQAVPGIVMLDDRPGAPPENIFWTTNLGEAGQVLHGYQSAWLSASLLEADKRSALVDALIEATEHWQVTLHTNKGLAGGASWALAASRDTATHPDVLEAFALLICAGNGPPAYPGIPGHEPDIANGRRVAAAIARAMIPIRRVAPAAGSYVSEGNYFEADWQRVFWGANFPRLLAAKRRYDPDGGFFVHHGVGDG